MEQFFEENSAWVENYPDVKVIKELPPLKVACYTYFGDEPESHAFEELEKWAKARGISFSDQSYRIFGYNNPDPSDVDSDETYGYEVCITIPDELYDTLEDVPEGFSKGTYDGVKRRILSGGKFAVASVKREGKEDIGEGIMLAWKRFNEWLRVSKYTWGGNQYLEEHLGFSEGETKQSKGARSMYEMKKEYFTGIPMIDEEHAQLFAYANQIYELLQDEFVADKYDNIRDLLGKLEDYAKHHFADEEAYMESIQYKKIFTQKVQHQAFVDELDKYDLDVIDQAENQQEVISNLLTFVTDWLVEHILNLDTQIGK